MWLYISKRLLFVVPTLFGILLLNFIIIHATPGGPVEQLLARYEHAVTTEVSGTESNMSSTATNQLRDDIAEQLKRYYDIDKPLWQQFFSMAYSYLTFNFGNSLYRDISVVDLIIEKLPVSISIGLWTTLLAYLISIPLGVYKAVHHMGRFDMVSSFMLVVFYSIPGFVLALMLIVFFAGGYYWQWFPLRGLVSDDFASLSWLGKIADYAWHMCLPVISSMLGAFAALTVLTKNSFLEEIKKHYVLIAYAAGLSHTSVLFGQIFRNAMLIIVSGLPATLIGIFFTSSLLIEIIFSLDGLGLLSYEAVLLRDYPVLFASLYLFTLLGLLLKIVSDVMFVVIDPRIHFDSRGA